MRETIIIIDFGGQYSQLIGRKVRESGVFCEILPYTAPVSAVRRKRPSGIIITGGDKSVKSPGLDPEYLAFGVPVLGIGYGARLLAYALGGEVSESRADAVQETAVLSESALFSGASGERICWFNHSETVSQLPETAIVTAQSPSCAIAAFEVPGRAIYGVSFHPEVNYTPSGSQIISNFLYCICKASGDWRMADYASEAIAGIKERVGDKKVLLALSGGVDSSVCAVMVAKAVGKQLTCVFVDTGLMRQNEGDEVEQAFSGKFDLNFIRLNCQDRFLGKLAGVADPERKRKIIGEEFIRVFEEEAKRIGAVDFLCQGTIYPDVIESGVNEAALVKSHHNVGGLPDVIEFNELLEPLRDLFKAEVRQLGLELGLPERLVWRQPFPGPGLAVRVIGEVTKEKLDLLREADAIFRQEVEKAGLGTDISQFFAILTGMRSVGVKGEARTYDHTIALRAINTQDFMTATWAEIPFPVLKSASERIVEEVEHVNRVVFDITSKPPGTIEWE